MGREPEQPARRGIRWANRAYMALHGTIALLFAICASALVVFAAVELYRGLIVRGALDLRHRMEVVLDAVGLLTIAVAGLELSQTVWEEEVQRTALMSAPTRVRRFLSRFMVVVVVALATEALIATFRFVHDDPSRLPHAAAIAVAAAALLVGWGVFIRMNLAAEAVEPEAMARAKSEDEAMEDEAGD